MGAKERREREKEQRRNQILDAARTLLLEKGINSTTVNKIAKLSELSVGTIYFYYKSKEEIFAALQEEGLQYLFDDIKKKSKKSSGPRQKLNNMLYAYFNFSQEHKDYFDILDYFLSAPEIIFPENFKYEIDQFGNRILDVIVDAVDEGIKKGIFKEIDSRKFAIMVWGNLHGLIHFKKLKTTILRGENIEDFIQFTIDSHINSLLK